MSEPDIKPDTVLGDFLNPVLMLEKRKGPPLAVHMGTITAIDPDDNNHLERGWLYSDNYPEGREIAGHVVKQAQAKWWAYQEALLERDEQEAEDGDDPGPA